MKCPRCGEQTCDCILQDPGYLAKAVGKQLSRLSGCEAENPSTTKTGLDSGADALVEPPESPSPERDDDWDQTPVEICQKIIGLFPWIAGELVLEPFRGDGNFYDNLPKHVRRDWCEIRQGRDFFRYDGQSDTIITNPPFRDAAGGENLVVPCLDRCLQLARKRVIYFVNHKVFNALTPGRLKEYGNRGWGITHLSVWDVRKWFGAITSLSGKRASPASSDVSRRELTMARFVRRWQRSRT